MSEDEEHRPIAEIEEDEAFLAMEAKAAESAALDDLEAFLNRKTVRTALDDLASFADRFRKDGEMAGQLRALARLPDDMIATIGRQRLALTAPIAIESPKNMDPQKLEEIRRRLGTRKAEARARQAAKAEAKASEIE